VKVPVILPPDSTFSLKARSILGLYDEDEYRRFERGLQEFLDQNVCSFSAKLLAKSENCKIYGYPLSYGGRNFCAVFIEHDYFGHFNRLPIDVYLYLETAEAKYGIAPDPDLDDDPDDDPPTKNKKKQLRSLLNTADEVIRGFALRNIFDVPTGAAGLLDDFYEQKRSVTDVASSRAIDRKLFALTKAHGIGFVTYVVPHECTPLVVLARNCVGVPFPVIRFCGYDDEFGLPRLSEQAPEQVQVLDDSLYLSGGAGLSILVGWSPARILDGLPGGDAYEPTSGMLSFEAEQSGCLLAGTNVASFSATAFAEHALTSALAVCMLSASEPLAYPRQVLAADGKVECRALVFGSGRYSFVVIEVLPVGSLASAAGWVPGVSSCYALFRTTLGVREDCGYAIVPETGYDLRITAVAEVLAVLIYAETAVRYLAEEISKAISGRKVEVRSSGLEASDATTEAVCPQLAAWLSNRSYSEVQPSRSSASNRLGELV